MHNPNAFLGLLTPALAVILSSQAPSWAATTSFAVASPFCLAGALAQGDETAETKRALDLRNASGADWNNGRFSDAAQKLEEALEIYNELNAASGDEGGYVTERAISLRALVWNTFRSGAEADGLGYFEDLIELADTYPAAAPQKPSAYTAVYQHSVAKESLKEALAFWKSVSDIYDAYDDKERLAQIMIDRAGSYSAFGEHGKARRDLNAAIEAHLAIEDFDGANWSRNNLGYSFLSTEEWSEAIGPIGEALAEVRAGRGLAAQSALGYNLLEVSKGASGGARPNRKLVDGLWAIAEEEARGQWPAIVAPERLLVAAMHAEVGRVGAKRAKGAADRLLNALPGAPAALNADLALHAAALMIDSGAAKEAKDLIDSIAITDGPVSPHLKVRQGVLAVSASAALRDQKAFDRNVGVAIDALEALDHSATTREAYESLAEAARAFPKSNKGRAVAASWQQIQRAGRAGGAGGSFINGSKAPNVDALAGLAAHAPLFELTSRDGKFAIKDLLNDDEVTRDFEWTVRTLNFNGMKMESFGGYIAVVDVNYGSQSSAKGSAPGLSLSDLQNFRPLAEGTSLYVTKTGATYYGQGTK